MNTNIKAKRVLCYGDSNTWGYMPAIGKRYPANIRWTGLLQEKLGSDFEIIEEGTNSRTTDFDDPKHIGKSGLQYLRPCLETHDPIDLIILMLGTNDLKERFAREPERVAKGIQKLLDAIKFFSVEEETNLPEILLVCPPIIDESVRGVEEKYKDGEAKSRKLPEFYKALASKNNCFYINLQEYVAPSKKDGYHLEQESHQKLADLFYTFIIKNS
jgi:lysophospholipase L1-like esterase